MSFALERKAMPAKATGAQAANVERFRQLLISLADANGTIRGLSIWNLSVAFNRRYRNETRAISDTAIRNYVDNGIAVGWLSLERENGIRGHLVFTLLPVSNEQDTLAREES